MALATPREPTFVDLILDGPWTFLLARIALTSAYWIGGLTKLTDWGGALAEAARFGLHPAWLVAGLTIAVELAGSALVIAGRWIWLGAGALGVFTALANLVANGFWAMQGPERFAAMNAFFEHAGLIAGLVLVAIVARRATLTLRARTWRVWPCP